MTVAETSGAPAGRAQEFFKGFFLPLLCALPGLFTYPFFVSYDQEHGVSNVGSKAIPAAALLALIGSLTLIIRWWKRARWRAYGVIAGFFGSPPLLAALFVLFILLFKVSLYPR